MRAINKIIIHCSATEHDMDVGVDEIRSWHTMKPPKGNGWSDIGYHYVITLDGEIQEGRPIERTGAHTKGHNHHSIGICYVGGLINGESADTRNEKQKDSLDDLLHELVELYPMARIYGHRDFSKKSCPNFDAHDTYQWVWRDATYGI